MSSLCVKPLPPPMKSTQHDEDDWETDPDFLNIVNEKESRWGAKTVAGSGHQESIRLDKLREEVLKSDQIEKERKLAQMPKASEGYGGKFGVQTDRVDRCAVGFEYKGRVEAHASQRDYSQGFGGTFGVQKDRVDKSAVGWDSHETVEKHESQKDYKMGFGGQFGVQSDRKDKSAAGWDEKEQIAKHESQTDYKRGFGGQFGVQFDRKDKSALGWDEVEKVKLHESQTDYKKGFGGQFGVQSDRQDKSALGWEEREKLQAHESQTDYKKGFGGQFGVQSDRKDKTAHGWDEHGTVEKHESQTDYKKGFGGQFGVQSDRQDKSALGWDEKQWGSGGGGEQAKTGTNRAEETDAQTDGQPKSDRPLVRQGAAKSLRSKFEQMAKEGDQQNLDRAREERVRRKHEDEQLRQQRQEEERQRQQRLEEQWAKQREEGDQEGGGGDGEEQQQRVQPPRQRPTIGVRLPYATAASDPLSERHSRLVDDHSSENELTTVCDTKMEEPQPPPVKVLPTAADNANQLRKMDMAGVLALELKHNTSDNAVAMVEQDEEKALVVPESGEWVGATVNSVEQQGQQRHQYELPPVFEAGVSSNVGAAPTADPTEHCIHSDTDRNALPPADPTPAVTEPFGGVGNTSPMAEGTTAIALFEYDRQDDDEIGFEVNDVITDIEQIDSGWWRGMCKGRYGLFPANYVQLIDRK